MSAQLEQRQTDHGQIEHAPKHLHLDNPAARIVLGVLRILFGITFLWAFVDKLFGFGKATPSESSWINEIGRAHV